MFITEVKTQTKERGENLRAVPVVVRHLIPQIQTAIQVLHQVSLRKTEKRMKTSQSGQIQRAEVGSPQA